MTHDTNWPNPAGAVRRSLATIVAAACLVAVGCRGAIPVASPTATPAELQPISIGVFNAGPANGPLLVALAKDYFKDVGLNASYQQFRDIPSETAALASGSLDVAVTAPSSGLFNQVNRGLQTKIVSSMGAFPAQGEPAALVVRKDLVDSGQLKTAADLKGRKVGLGGTKSGSQGWITARMLEPAGLTLEDFDIVDLTFPDAVVALTNKSIDAAYLPDPFKLQAERQGIVITIARPPAVGRSPVATLYGSKFIAQRADVAKAAMVALVRGARDLQGDGAKSEANLAIMSQYAGLPVDTLRGMDAYAYDPDLKPDADAIMDMQQFFMAEGQVEYTTALPTERLIDTSFSQYAVDQLGPYSSH